MAEGQEMTRSQKLRFEHSRTGWNSEKERRDERIFDLKEPIQNILGNSSLRSDIEEGRITTLIGDDTSGRIPTIIFRNILPHFIKRMVEKSLQRSLLMAQVEVNLWILKKMLNES